MKTSLLPLLAASAACALLTGCASSRNAELLQSFEDISAGYTRNGFKVNQIRTMSVNGQLPFVDIGALYYFKPARGNLAAIGLTLDDPTPTPFTNSYELVQKYDSTADMKTLTKIRSAVLEVAAQAAKVVVAEGVASEAAKAAADARAEKAKADKDNKGADVAATKLADTERAESAAQKALQTERTALLTSSSNALKLIKDKNVAVFRWQLDSKKDFKLVAGDVASAKLHRELGRSGFVIVAGMRSRTLFLNGKDGKALEASVERHFNTGNFLIDWCPWIYSPGMFVVTHLREAQHIAYVSEQSLSSAIELHATYTKGMKLKDIDKISLDLAISSISSLANAGLVQSTGNERRPVVIGGPPNQSHGAGCECCAPQWTPIMAVTTKLQDLDELFERKPRLLNAFLNAQPR